MKKFFDEFREFAMRGNVIDLAVGIIIGVAFKDIVDSLVNDVIMPPVGLLLGDVDFTDLFINLSDKSYDSLAQAQEAGAATINYGVFINTLINFLIIALVLFVLIRQMNRLQSAFDKAEAEAPTAPTTKECPYCFTEIPIQATRCPHCTSELKGAPAAESA